MVSEATQLLLHDFCDNSVDLNDQTILVTGGTGSFGKQFVQTVLERCVPKRLIVSRRGSGNRILSFRSACSRAFALGGINMSTRGLSSISPRS